MVTLIHINPETRTIEEREADGSLKGFQALVGGLIECVATIGDIEIWANEEGRIKPPPYFYWTLNRSPGGVQPPIFVGPAFIAGRDRDEIEDAPITVEGAGKLVRFLTTEQARELWPVREATRRAEAKRRHEKMERETGQSFGVIFVESTFPG